MLKNYRYILKGLDCANCAREIEERLQQEKDLEQVVVNFSTLQLSFQTNRDDGVYSYIKNIVKEVEPEVEVLEKKEDIHQEKGLMLSMIRLGVGIFFIIVGCYVSLTFYLGDIFILIAYVVLLFPTAKNAFQMLKRSHTIHENFLITLSCVGAYLVGEKLEGFMVIILYEIGKILEEKAVHHSRKSIADLMNIKPETAWLEDGKEVLPENVKVGDIILVKPGEKVPLDGIIVDGSSHLNTSSLTGESKLLFVQSGMEVLSGSINQDGILKMKVTKDYQNSTVSKILELVENATDQKAKTETYVQHFSKIYTPIVIILAIMVGLLLPLFTSVSYQESIYRALTFLVISCPCAIAISVPLSYFSGIGRASREGILIKGSNYLDALRHITTIIFDKTGTLTTGEFVVTKVEVFDKNYTKEDVLKYAVLGESFSNHPIAKSILAYYPKEFNTTQVEDYQEIAGKGLSYQLKKKNIKIGNKDYVNFKKKVDLGTNVFVSVDEVVIGRLVLNDCLKSGTREAILRLKNKGIEVKMFTGDARETALSIGKELQIEDVKYELLPTDKYQEFVLVMETHPQGKVAFVGDGINDSPVLARADIGISMGGVGSSAAIEASDMVIMTDAIEKIEQAIFISQKTNRIIRENLIFSLFTKGIVLLFSVIGIGGMWQAIFADVGVTLITIFNTLRILKDEK